MVFVHLCCFADLIGSCAGLWTQSLAFTSFGMFWADSGQIWWHLGLESLKLDDWCVFHSWCFWIAWWGDSLLFYPSLCLMVATSEAKYQRRWSCSVPTVSHACIRWYSMRRKLPFTRRRGIASLGIFLIWWFSAQWHSHDIARQPLRHRLSYNNKMRPFTAPVNPARELPHLFTVMTGRHFQLIPHPVIWERFGRGGEGGG